ncbi:MAG: ABC transporter permease subunit [Nitrososphaerota archaeon]|nr:ABC transporter permease subunit [Nitrososphaerota archaeon]MDG6967581.1 ABC transporter permease subunit [Nitrososphaerota archaeon]MDG6978906.1 ABC transporter permease subunit [Nitrososphaerota archaeon]MDG7022784.1 ABC transporter permease subunit [Nitrososphaerota archaeon]
MLLSAVEFYPLLYGLYLSLTGAGGGATLANYSQVVSDGDFWTALTVSLVVSVLSTALMFCLGLALTFLVRQATRGRRVLECVFLAPLAMAPIAVGIAWAPSTVWDDFQAFTHLVLGLPYFNELSALFYIPVMSLSIAWEWAPLVMLVCLGIVDSTSEVEEAAALNGASAWRVFREITIPSIVRSPVMVFVMVLQFVEAMWAFEVPLAWSKWLGVSTSVGTASDTVSLYLYKLISVPGLGDPVRLVSAMAVALLLVTLVGSTLMARLLTKVGSAAASLKGTARPEAKARATPRKRRPGGRALLYLAFVAAALYSLFPPIAMALDAAGANIAALITILGGVLPFSSGAFFITPVYYQSALGLAAFPTRALNSLAIAGLSVGAALAVGIPVSYVLARVDIKGKGALSFVFLALRTVSPFAVVLPLYLLFDGAGLWDTYQGVALAELVFVLSVVVWMVKGFFADIPQQVYDSASVFASTEAQVFRRVALPLVARGVAVTAVFGILLVWNEFLISTLFTGPHTTSVAVGIWAGLSERGNSTPFIDVEAAATVAYLPALAALLAIRRHLARGFSLATAR